MAEPVVILTQGLKKSYGKVQALQGVDLAVHQGEVFGFLGPNGAGKTTTIRCLLDLIRPDGGTLRVLYLGDGISSVGYRTPGALAGEIRRLRNESPELTVSAVGIGSDADQSARSRCRRRYAHLHGGNGRRGGSRSVSAIRGDKA